MIAKIVLLVIFFGTMIAIGIYCRRHSTNVQGFVLGSRNVGPWLTAFAYGTSYFSAVVLCRAVRMEIRHFFYLDRHR